MAISSYYSTNAGGETEEPCSAGRSHADAPSLRVGCALLPKKVSRYLTTEMKSAARDAGIELFQIDRSKPLEEQGPMNAILHKLQPSKEWEIELEAYSNAHPDVRIIDSVKGIRTLRDRATMLSVLQGDGVVIQSPDSMDGSTARVNAPAQVHIPEGMKVADAEKLITDAGMQPPLLVKPQWTDGREGSHGLAVVYDFPSLTKLLSGSVSTSFSPPVVMQQFVEHGGILHKVYVLGGTSVVCKRPSLGDHYLSRQAGMLTLPRISCKTVRLDQNAPNPDAEASSPLPIHEVPDSETELLTPSSQPGSPGDACCSYDSLRPPDWVTRALAQQLRSRLGMELFNFDLISSVEPTDSGEALYYVVDINYFPGVDKIPDFEEAFIEFLTAACRS